MLKIKNVLLLTFIFILGLSLRIWHIDKPQGLWNDEYVSWFIASAPFPQEFFNEMIKNCHMPLYYFFLKFWMSTFGNTDLILRLSSVFLGGLSILTMFFVGKKFKDEKLGLFCALLSAVSGFLIYFSQEVRLYQLLFLICSINLFAWLNLAREQSKKNFIFFAIINIFIILTHTIGFVFVIFNILFICIYLIKKDKNLLKPSLFFIFGVFFVCLLVSPFLYKVFRGDYFSQFWSGFSLGKIFFTFADYFSPIQVNIINTPRSLLSFIFKQNNYMYLIFGVLPLFISIVAITKALISKNRELVYLSLTAGSYFIALLVASSIGKLVLETKYSVEIYPLLLLLLAFGLMNFKKTIIRKSLICVMIILPLFHYLVNKNSVPKLGRSEGNKVVIQLLREAKIRPSDKVFLTYYSKDKFWRYLGDDKYKIIAIDKYNFTGYLFGGKYSYSQVLANGKDLYYEGFKNNDTKYFDERLDDIFLKHMYSGERVAVVLLKNVSFFSKDQIKQITLDKKEYKNTPLLFLVFSYIKNNTLTYFSKHLTLDLVLECDDWVLVVFRNDN